MGDRAASLAAVRKTVKREIKVSIGIRPHIGVMSSAAIELSIVMPCLNEAATIGRCVAKARLFLARAGISGEVIVADNGSTDGSQKLAREGGAQVVDIEERGYGRALIGGIRAARGSYVIMGDSDDSYDFGALDAFLT